MTENTDTDGSDRGVSLSTPVALAVIIAIWGLVGFGAGAALSNASPYQGDVTISAPGGEPEVVLTGSGKADFSTINQSADELDLKTTNGDIRVNGTGSARLESLTGVWTNTTNLSVDSKPLTFDPEDKQQVEVAGKTWSLNFTDMVVNDGEVDFVYNGSSGDTSLTIQTGIGRNATLRAVDDDGTELDNQTVDADGSVTVVMPNSKHNVSLKSQNLSSRAPLFPNATTSPGLGNWTNGSQNASLDTMADYIGRVGGIVFGGRGGVGAAPAILLGFVMMGVVVVGGSSVGAGPVAGAVAGISVIGVITAVGLAPAWLWAVVLFGLGAVATAVVVRAWS